uniref:hypothetical protein n=1 Tax=Nocardia kruczakiae TaxID=261477 RepID=UPI0035B55A07
MSWVSFPEEGFAWTGTGGEPTWFETFQQICRGFCPKCGSSVASKGDEAGLEGSRSRRWMILPTWYRSSRALLTTQFLGCPR